MRKFILIGLAALLLVAPAAGAPASLARTSLSEQVAGTCDATSRRCFGWRPRSRSPAPAMTQPPTRPSPLRSTC
jgi:hypothetical protein